MKMLDVKCSHCDKIFKKEKKEYTRQLKNGRSYFYCSRKCSGIANPATLKNFSKYKGDITNLGRLNKCDIFSPFRTKMRRIRKRNKYECDIDHLYLKDVWDNQNGKCSNTGVSLVLEETVSNPNYSASVDRIDSNKGYIKGNIHFISVTTNYAKNKYSEDVLLEYFKIIKNNEELKSIQITT